MCTCSWEKQHSMFSMFVQVLFWLLYILPKETIELSYSFQQNFTYNNVFLCKNHDAVDNSVG